MSLFSSVLCRLVLCLQLSVLRFVRRSPRGAWCDTFDTTEKQPNCQHGALAVWLDLLPSPSPPRIARIVCTIRAYEIAIL